MYDEYTYKKVFKGERKILVHVFFDNKTGTSRGYSSTIYPTRKIAEKQYLFDIRNLEDGSKS